MKPQHPQSPKRVLDPAPSLFAKPRADGSRSVPHAVGRVQCNVRGDYLGEFRTLPRKPGEPFL